MTIAKGSNGHTFGRKRPSATGTAIHREPPRDTHFRDYPAPTGKAPFRLDIKDILAPAEYEKIAAKKRLVFHLNGDMGGIKYGEPQAIVAEGMEKDLLKANADGLLPDFLYITGDCVYFNGEVSQYYTQFYEPYELYHRPIFAVPGNHDGENLDSDTTLDGFMRNFCARTPAKTPESQGSFRTPMVQPNCYWTLLTPLVSIVGLYSNVPEGGEIRSPQLDWIVNELKTLPSNLPLFVALHHPLYSADDHHSGSSHMRKVLDQAAAAAGRYPDMVLAGHVHNYQRLSSVHPQRGLVPHIVTGAGGYHNLHHIMKVDGEKMVAPVNFDAGDGETVTLNSYSDDHHGFLRVEVTPGMVTGRYYEVPRPQEPRSKGSSLLDYWEFDIKKKAWVTNRL
jgi:Icc-related predicted phosphoesterase